MAQPRPSNPLDMIEVDPNAEKKLADILKQALSTRSSRHGNDTNRQKPAYFAIDLPPPRNPYKKE